MEKFDGRVAVITGGGSGIGLAMARRFAREGMRIAIADVNQARVDAVADELPEAIGVVADVADPDAVEELATTVLERFGAVHVVCANAGVSGPTGARLWEIPLDQWRWVLGVNLFGVIHTLRAFVPHVIEHADSHVVVTASMAALTQAATMPQYFAAKHAVVSLAETLRLQFERDGIGTGVSVLVPGGVETNLSESRTGNGAPESGVPGFNPRKIPAEEVAEAALGALRDRRLYVVTHPEGVARVRARIEPILEAFES